MNAKSLEKSNKELAQVPKFELVKMDAGNVGAALLENLGGQRISPFDFDRLSFPAAGATFWTIQNPLTGEAVVKKEITGVVFYYSSTRSYWAGEFSGTGAQPDCSSTDGISGQGIPAGYCVACPQNKFGSRGRGKGCKESRELYILQEKTYLPLVVSVPPSSIKVFHNLCIALGVSGIKLHEGVVKFSLAVDKNADGIKFSKLQAMLIAKLPPEKCEYMQKFRDSFIEAFAAGKTNEIIPSHNDQDVSFTVDDEGHDAY